MNSFEKQKEKLKTEIENSENMIDELENQLIHVREKKLSYKRKEDAPNFDKTLSRENEITNFITYLKDNIPVLEKKLRNLEHEEINYYQTRVEMEKVLNEIAKGLNRVEASDKSRVSLSKIYKWCDDGKLDKDENSRFFYNQINLYENYYLSFFAIFKREFKKKSKIHIMRSFVPHSYPKRMEKYYNEDSKLWFSMLKLKDESFLYYFALQGEVIPRIILKFDSDYTKSNFSLYNEEVFLLLRISGVNAIKEDFKVISHEQKSSWYYVSLGRFERGDLSGKIEVLITKHIGEISNPIDLF